MSRAVPARGLISAMPLKKWEAEQGEGTGGPKVHSTGCWVTYQGPTTTGLCFSPDSHCWAGFNWSLGSTPRILLGKRKSLPELPAEKLRPTPSPPALCFGCRWGLVGSLGPLSSLEPVWQLLMEKKLFPATCRSPRVLP